MMTGTPLQNDLNELQNLLHFLLPTVFQELEGDQDLAAMLQVQAAPPPHSRRACARQRRCRVGGGGCGGGGTVKAEVVAT